VRDLDGRSESHSTPIWSDPQEKCLWVATEVGWSAPPRRKIVGLRPCCCSASGRGCSATPQGDRAALGSWPSEAGFSL